MTDAFPLKWPEGWPRTAPHRRASGDRFSTMTYKPGQTYKSRSRITSHGARTGLIEELQRLGALMPVISTNVPVRQDGEIVSGAGDRRYDDPGVAIYFKLKGRPMVMAQDAYDGVAENMRSLALAIDAMRSLERHGGGTMMQRAFDGFAALPPPAGSKPKRPWWEVLRFPAEQEDRDLISAAEVEARFKTLAKKHHPDAGGSADAFNELSVAKDDALAELAERGE